MKVADGRSLVNFQEYSRVLFPRNIHYSPIYGKYTEWRLKQLRLDMPTAQDPIARPFSTYSCDLISRRAKYK